MEKFGVPHLCGGILFNLILEARKVRKKKRDRINEGTDNLSNVDIYSGLVYVVTGEYLVDYGGGSVKKCVSMYRSCDKSSGTYIPFTDSITQNTFLSQMQNEKELVYKRIIKFKDDNLNDAKCEWLVRAIVEIIQSDECISDSQLFEIRSDVFVKKSEIASVTDFSFIVFLGSVLKYVMEFCPDCESGKETFLLWYSRSGERAEWKYVGNVGENNNSIKIHMDTDDLLNDITVDVPKIVESNSERVNEVVSKQEEEFDEDTILEAQRFCVKYEAELSLLPLCQIAYNVDPIHNNVRKMYTDYNMCSSKVKRRILQYRDIPELKFEDEWIDKCVKRYDEHIMRFGLATRDFLYEGGKYLHLAFKAYSDYIVEEINPRIFIRPCKTGINDDYTTLGFYIGDFLWCRENQPDYYVEPPMDYLWRLCNLGSCWEYEMTYWVCLFVIHSSFHMATNAFFADERWAYINISSELIRTQEDLYYYALFQLYWLYEIERSSSD